MATEKFQVELVRDGQEVVSLMPNEFKGNELDYRHKDILSYHLLKKAVERDECVSLSGRPAYSSEEWATVKNPRWIITSPNMRTVPAPSFGLQSFQAFDNGKYGLNDRCQHPQIICKGIEYAACNPTFSEELSDLFWTPTTEDTDLIVGTVIQTDVRVLKPQAANRLQAQLTKTAAIAFDVLGRYPSATLLSSFLFYAQQCLQRLTEFGLNFMGILRSVADFQRALVDCRGLSTWIDVYYPRMKPKNAEELGKKWPVDRSLMGCFTHDPSIVQTFHQIGIPVWWIRPDFAVNLSDTRVFAYGQCREMTVPDHVSLRPYLPFGQTKSPFPVIYKGCPGSEWQRRIMKLSSNVTDQTIPSKIAWKKMESKLPEVSPPAAQEVTIYSLPSMLNSSGSAPTALNALSLSSIPSLTTSSRPAVTGAAADPLPDAFDFRPPEIPTWSQALVQAQGTKAPPRSSLYRGFALPDPSIITSAATAETRARYALGWASARAVHVANFAMGTDMGIINKNDWRNFLHSIVSLLHVGPPAIEGTSSSEDAAPSSSTTLPPTSSTTTTSVRTAGVSRRQQGKMAKVPVPQGMFAPVSRRPEVAQNKPLPPPHPSLPPVPTSASLFLPSTPSSSTSSVGKRALDEAGDAGPTRKQTRTTREENEYLAKLREEAREVEKICLFETSITLGSGGDVTETIGPGAIAELVWELREMNFRIEFLLLDQHLATQYWPSTDCDDPAVNTSNEATRLARELQIRRVFSPGDAELLSLLPMTMPNRDNGLAAYSWVERHRALVQVHAIMVDWKGIPASLKNVSLACNELSCAGLEAEIALTYCRLFRGTFGRSPIIPCRLPFKARVRETPVRSFGSLGVSSS